jgi:hypothetical protein
MPDNGSGTYTRVNTFVSLNPITAAGHNENWSDVESALTNRVCKDGQSTMTAPLKLASGSAAAPAATFGADTDTGLYRSGANAASIAAGGTQIAEFSASGLDVKTGSLLQAGAAIFPVATANISDDAVTYAKLQNVSATSRLLGRASSGAGNAEELTIGAGMLLDSTTILAPGLSVAGDYRGLVISNNTSTPNTQIDLVASGISMEDSSGNIYRARTISTTINAAAKGVNGLDTGALANSTWYAVYGIYNPAAGTFAGLLSTSATSPTMPSGYTAKARIGWVRTNGSAVFLRTVQYGNRAQYFLVAGGTTTVWPSIASGTSGSPSTPTWTSTSVASLVPTTAMSIHAICGASATGGDVALTNSSATGSITSGTAPPILKNATNLANLTSGEIPLVVSQTVFYASNLAGGFALCTGWTDNI